jgi:predicted O-methyltransferase YrrM
MNALERATKIGVEGFLHCAELEKLIDLACARDVLEVGSFKGLSAWGMASVARTLRAVDTFRANSAGQVQMEQLTTFAEFNQSISRYSNVTYFIGTSEDAARLLHDDYDFVFLDAMHTYEDVKADIERWWPRVRAGGTMAFHDYGHEHFPGVKQAVDERFGPLPNTVVTLGWLHKE